MGTKSVTVHLIIGYFVIFFFLCSERLKMDNTITQDDDDGGEIMFICTYLLCTSRKYPYPYQAAFVNSNGDWGRWDSKAKLLKESMNQNWIFQWHGGGFKLKQNIVT